MNQYNDDLRFIKQIKRGDLLHLYFKIKNIFNRYC